MTTGKSKRVKVRRAADDEKGRHASKTAVQKIYARMLLLLGLRTRVICDATGLTDSQIRSIKSELADEGYKLPAQPGPQQKAAWILNSRPAYVQATLLMNIYRSLHIDADKNIDLVKLIRAYSIYLKERAAILSNSMDETAQRFKALSISDAYTLAAALRHNEIDNSAAMIECPECHVEYYFAISQNLVSDCPFCYWRVRDSSSDASANATGRSSSASADEAPAAT